MRIGFYAPKQKAWRVDEGHISYSKKIADIRAFTGIFEEKISYQPKSKFMLPLAPRQARKRT